MFCKNKIHENCLVLCEIKFIQKHRNKEIFCLLIVQGVGNFASIFFF